MKKEDLKELAQAAAKNIKSEADLNELKQMLTKMTLETVLNAELDEHLGYSKHEKSNTDNSRNGYTTKTLQTEDGQFELETPRDRNGDFEPQLVKKNQDRKSTRLNSSHTDISRMPSSAWKKKKQKKIKKKHKKTQKTKNI